MSESTPAPRHPMGPRSGDLRLPKQSSQQQPSSTDPPTPPDQRLLSAPIVPGHRQEASPFGWVAIRLVLGSLSLGFLVAIVWFTLGLFEQPQPIITGQGRLVVVAVFDHLRGDLAERWSPVFDGRGFEKFRLDGVAFTDAQLPYATTDPSAGQASISTGVSPARHGILGDSWLNQHRKHPSNRQLGALLKATTVSDTLLRAGSGKSRVLSLGFDREAAELLGGVQGTVLAYDSETGVFRAAVGRQVPAWVDRFNQSSAINRWEARDWLSLLVPTVAEQYAGKDAAPGEGKLLGRDGTSFPHPMGQDSAYLKKLPQTPLSNELLWELAREAIAAEQLGEKETDLLWLSFTASKAIGEAFGPDSHEMLDLLVRTDRLLGMMLEQLRERYGIRRVSLIVTSSSGLAPLPERIHEQHPTAQRFKIAEEFGELEAALNRAFGARSSPDLTWLRRPLQQSYPWIEWNQKRLQQSGIPAEVISGFARNWLKGRSPTKEVYDQTALVCPSSEDQFLRQVQLSYSEDHAGDWYLLTQPYAVADSGPWAGSRSGSPYSYDTHVPIYAFGYNVPPLGLQAERLDALIVTSMIYHALGLPRPENGRPLPRGF